MVVEFIETTRVFVYTQKSISYLFIFLSLFRQSTVELFEITKEGTESILIKEILF